jgi:hypothetical protein
MAGTNFSSLAGVPVRCGTVATRVRHGVDEAIRRIAPECERAELVAGCAFLIVSSAIITGPRPDTLDSRIKARLKMSAASGSGSGERCTLP